MNTIVAFVEGEPDVTRVAQICARFGLSERALQRLTRRRLGLTPKWLIQRRRLQEAAERLRRGDGSLADVAATLGYADQPHFTHDFHAVTGMTPGSAPPASCRRARAEPLAQADVGASTTTATASGLSRLWSALRPRQPEGRGRQKTFLDDLAGAAGHRSRE